MHSHLELSAETYQVASGAQGLALIKQQMQKLTENPIPNGTNGIQGNWVVYQHYMLQEDCKFCYYKEYCNEYFCSCLCLDVAVLL